jgi:hypothetical protein
MPVKDTKLIVTALSNESQRIEEDANFSGKSHLNAASIWIRRHYWLGVPATLAGALAGAAIVKDYQALAGALSLAATLLTGLVTFLKPYERASQHKAVGDQFLSLRNDSRVFRTIELLEVKEIEELSLGLKTLSARRNDLNKGSPEFPRKAFEKARKGIEEGESKHQIDAN